MLLLVAVNVIAVPSESIHGPNWLLGAAGLIFFLGGLSVFIPRDEKTIQGLLAAVLFTLFGVIGSWIAFGPGERSFGGSASIGPFSLTGISPELVGRLAFGCGGAITDLAALLFWIRWIRELVRDK